MGRGARGTVYLARHIELEEYRAVKEVSKACVDYNQFRREALILKSIRYPGIPIVYDLEETDTDFYLIEECIEGENLYQVITELGAFSPELTVSYGIQICHLVYILHSAKPNPVLYLDLQPKNLMLCHDTVKLVDFDHAVKLEETELLTKRYGTVGFAAPEQYSGGVLNEQTDIYAIGAVLQYMCTGTFPKCPGAKKIYRPTAGNRSLEKVIWKCLRERPEERYGSVTELETVLKKIQNKQNEKSVKKVTSLTIAVAGTEPGAGATHIAVGLAAYLKRKGYEVVYVEENASGAVLQWAECTGATMDVYGDFHISGVPMRPAYGSAVKMKEYNWQICIKDCGAERKDFYSVAAEAHLLICGSKPWEGEPVKKILETAETLPGLAIVYNHYCEELAKKLPVPQASIPCFLIRRYENPWKPDQAVEKVFERLEKIWFGTEITDLKKKMTWKKKWFK